MKNRSWRRLTVGLLCAAIALPGFAAAQAPDAALSDLTVAATQSVEYGSGTITKDGTNLRSGPSTADSKIGTLNKGDAVTLVSIPVVIDANHWFTVIYNGVQGYVQSPYVNIVSTGSMSAPSGVTTDTNTYCKLTMSSANLREAPNGTSLQTWFPADGLLRLAGAPVSAGGYTWYPVYYKSTTRVYYVRGDCASLVNASGDPVTVTPTPVPTATPGPSGQTTAAPDPTAWYVRLIKTSANLRSTPNGTKVGEWVGMHNTLPVAAAAISKGGYTWYPVNYNNTVLYVRGDCVELVSTPSTPAVTVQPTATPTIAPGTYGYIRTTANEVNLRLEPAGELITRLGRDLVLPQQSSPTTAGGYTWYYVLVNNYRGYIRGDCASPCDASGNITDPQSTVTPNAPIVGVYGHVKLTADKVNLRNKPAGSSLTQLPKDSVLPITGAIVTSGNYRWYPVTAGNVSGYVRSDCVVEVDNGGTTITPTPAPDPTPGGLSTWGYICISKSSTNVRKDPNGSKIASASKGQVVPVTGATASKDGYTWYPVAYNGSAAWIRSDCCFKLTTEQEQAYVNYGTVPQEATPVPGTTATPAPAAVQYVQTTVDKVNLRAAASKDSAAPYNVPVGTVMHYSKKLTSGGSTWYAVVYDNTNVYVLGSCVKEMTAAEYEAYIQQNPTNTPQIETIEGYVKTTKSNTNLRATAAGKVLGTLSKDVTMPYTAKPTTYRGYTWYYVTTTSGQKGYVRGDCVTVVNPSGTATPEPSHAPVVTPAPGTATEASYTTLKRGSSGTAVKNLVTELKRKGFYSGDITSTYTTAVESAVKKFQSSVGLTADGIAGSNTQHALFGTVPVGSADTSDLSMAIYPAEKIDWYTGGIQTLWPKGANIKVYDVMTGITWWAHRWSGAYHADVEPLTAADTARLCRIYGVSSAEQIASKNLWQRRPCLVTIGTRTFACSLYGVPHNYPQGDTISSNDMKGQVCIHFTNSRTHGGNQVDSYHTEAIQYAWEHAPNGHI